jgi:hypothetical protein
VQQSRTYPLKSTARRIRFRCRDPLTSSRGCLRPSCARPLGGPRISSAAWAAWHRLGCWLRGTTRPRLCTPGPQLHAPPRCWCAYSGHLPLGAPTRRVERARGPGPARVGLLGLQCSVRALFRTASFKIK